MPRVQLGGVPSPIRSSDTRHIVLLQYAECELYLLQSRPESVERALEASDTKVHVDVRKEREPWAFVLGFDKIRMLAIFDCFRLVR